MAKYQELYRLPNNLYAQGCPVLIEVAVLQKELESGTVFVQLKFRNVSEYNVNSIKVLIQGYGPNGKDIVSEKEFYYLDLNEPHYAVFGQDIPVILNDTIIRKFSVCVNEVVVSDGTIWESDEYITSTMPNEVVEREKNYLSLIKLYPKYSKLKTGSKLLYLAEEFEKLGDYKNSDQYSDECSEKGIALEIKFNEHLLYSYNKSSECIELLDKFSKLTKKYENNENVKQFKSKAQQQADKLAKRARKRKITVITIISIILALTALIIINFSNIEYILAGKLLEAKQYENAISLYSELGDFKDSADKVKQSNYLWGCDLLNEKEYDSAVHKFYRAENYSDSAEKLKQSYYLLACEEYDKGDYEYAIVDFGYSDNYKDSAEKIKLAKYGYIIHNQDSSDDTTYKYLNELKAIGYKDTNALYNDLYSWKAQIFSVSTSRNNNYGIIKSVYHTTSYLSFKFKLTGGTPGQKTTFTHTIKWPDGSVSKSDWDWEYRGDGDDLGFHWDDGIDSSPGNMVVSIYEKSTGKYIGGYTLELY